MSKEIVIGTRGSKLALCQSEYVKKSLEKSHNDYAFSLKIIKTIGDKILDVPLSKIGDKGLFVKEIEEALIKGEIDIAVHSMKDLPSYIPEELIIGAVPKRIDRRDVLISREQKSLKDLSSGAVIGTSSLRRKAQLLSFRKDLKFTDIRGNLDTRLKKLYNGEVDALVLAAAGLIRMGWSGEITEYISPALLLPAAGQGILAVESRKDDEKINSLLETIDDPESRNIMIAERAFLSSLEGGCQVPIGAMAEITGHKILLYGLIAALDGTEIIRGKKEGTDPLELGRELAEDLLKRGGEGILEKIRNM